jgi:hypothetical protein
VIGTVRAVDLDPSPRVTHRLEEAIDEAGRVAVTAKKTATGPARGGAGNRTRVLRNFSSPSPCAVRCFISQPRVVVRTRHQWAQLLFSVLQGPAAAP